MRESVMQSVKATLSEFAPRSVQACLVSAYNVLHPARKFALVLPRGRCVQVRTRRERYITVHPTLWERGSEAWRSQKYEKYTLPGFVEVEQGDVVVDVGAFIGEFSIPAAARGETVVALEPDPDTFECLRQNVAPYRNIEPYNVLLDEESRRTRFYRGRDPTESSIIGVDKGGYDVDEVMARRLDELLPELGHGVVDFLKVDAEGAEPEVLAGCEALDLGKVAIDASEERGGETTETEVVALLDEYGFETRVRRPSEKQAIVYGRS